MNPRHMQGLRYRESVESDSSWLESQQTENKSATQRKIYLVHISEILFLETMLAHSVYNTLSHRGEYVGEQSRDWIEQYGCFMKA
jgi:hypothetical protein